MAPKREAEDEKHFVVLNLDNDTVWTPYVAVWTTQLTAYCREHLTKLPNGEINYQEVISYAYNHMTELLATEMRRLMHEEYERKYRIKIPDGDHIVSTYASVPTYFLLDFRDLQTTPIPSIQEICERPIRAKTFRERKPQLDQGADEPEWNNAYRRWMMDEQYVDDQRINRHRLNALLAFVFEVVSSPQMLNLSRRLRI